MDCSLTGGWKRHRRNWGWAAVCTGNGSPVNRKERKVSGRDAGLTSPRRWKLLPRGLCCQPSAAGCWQRGDAGTAWLPQRAAATGQTRGSRVRIQAGGCPEDQPDSYRPPGSCLRTQRRFWFLGVARCYWEPQRACREQRSDNVGVKDLGVIDTFLGFPVWLRCKEFPCNAGDTGWIPGSWRFPGGGNGNPVQYSYLENPMHWGALHARVHRLAKSPTQLSDWAGRFLRGL